MHQDSILDYLLNGDISSLYDSGNSVLNDYLSSITSNPSPLPSTNILSGSISAFPTGNIPVGNLPPPTGNLYYTSSVWKIANNEYLELCNKDMIVVSDNVSASDKVRVYNMLSRFRSERRSSSSKYEVIGLVVTSKELYVRVSNIYAGIINYYYNVDTDNDNSDSITIFYDSMSGSSFDKKLVLNHLKGSSTTDILESIISTDEVFSKTN